MLMLRVFFAILILTLFLTPLGCAPLMDEPTYFKCKQTADCPKGYICEENSVFDKVCRAGVGKDCEDDVICAEDLVCDPDSKTCVETDETTTHL